MQALDFIINFEGIHTLNSIVLNEIKDYLEFTRFLFGKRLYEYDCTCPSGGMVDAADLKSVASDGVRVQVPPRALFCNRLQMANRTMEIEQLIVLHVIRL